MRAGTHQPNFNQLLLNSALDFVRYCLCHLKKFHTSKTTTDKHAAYNSTRAQTLHQWVGLALFPKSFVACSYEVATMCDTNISHLLKSMQDSSLMFHMG